MIQFHLEKIQKQIFLKKKKVDNFFLARMEQSLRNLIKIPLLKKRYEAEKPVNSDSKEEKASSDFKSQET